MKSYEENKKQENMIHVIKFTLFSISAGIIQAYHSRYFLKSLI
jgi:hypothetical protein